MLSFEFVFCFVEVPIPSVFDNNVFTDGWEYLEEIPEDNLGIRFHFHQILGFESDMAFSDITIDCYITESLLNTTQLETQLKTQVNTTSLIVIDIDLNLINV